MATVQLCKSDLPPNHCRPIQDALRKLHHRFVADIKDKKKSRASKWADFARALKGSLDQSFSPQWHVLVGDTVGFACKKREGTMGVWRIDKTLVMIWKSPAMEAGDAAAPAAETSEDDKSKDEKVKEAKTKNEVKKPKELKILEADDEVTSISQALREELLKAPTDLEELAQTLRRRLTADFGTIWHVVAGSEFALHCAENRRNFISASFGETQIVCFQHEQQREQLNWSKMISLLLWILVPFCAACYMTLNYLCKEGSAPAEHAAARWVQRKMCRVDWSEKIGMLGMVAAAAVLVVRKFRASAKRKAA